MAVRELANALEQIYCDVAEFAATDLHSTVRQGRGIEREIRLLERLRSGDSLLQHSDHERLLTITLDVTCLESISRGGLREGPVNCP